MDTFQQQALHFEMPTHKFDPLQIPQDGEQYLQSVAYERNNCPIVVRKPLNKIAKKKNETEDESDSQSIWDQYNKIEFDNKTRTPLLPTDDWLRIQSNAFHQLQEQVAKIRENFVIKSENDLPSNNTECHWLEHCKNKKPLLQRMFHIYQRTLEKLVDYQSRWLIDDVAWYINNRAWLMQWIYCSLACLRPPFEPNLMNSLREIAKTCHRLRTKLNEKDIIFATPLNLIICIVSRNFKQSDLTGVIQ